jgi:hypothetical protein
VPSVCVVVVVMSTGAAADVHCDLPMPTQLSTRGPPPPPAPPLAREGLSLSMPHYLPWTAPCMFAKSVTDE